MFKTALFFFATSYFAWYMERFETKMVYPFDNSYVSPHSVGEPRLEERWLETDDGERLVLWQAAAESGLPTILYLPGNAGGLKDRAQRFSQLIDAGYGIVALGYRGSSGSSGQPDEALLTKDAILVARTIKANRTILYGESLGTAVAIKLAASGLGDAVVLEAPFTSIKDLISAQYPTEDLAHLVTQEWDSVSGMSNVTQPLLVLHGSDDKVVPVEMGRRVFSVAQSSDKTFHEIDGVGHSDLWTADTRSTLFSFFDRSARDP